MPRRSLDSVNPALAVLLLAVLSMDGVRAAPILPDSIPNVPVVSSSAPPGILNVVPLGDVLTDQYQSKGLLFPNVWVSSNVAYGTAVTQVNGVKVWAPVLSSFGGAVFDFGGIAFMTGELVVPGTNTPAATSALTVEILKAGPQVGVTVWGWDRNGNLLGTFQNTGLTGPHGGTLVTLQAPGIQSFSTSAGVQSGFDIPWGVAEVDVGRTPTATPEPSTTVLAGFGLLGLVVWRSRKGLPVKLPRGAA